MFTSVDKALTALIMAVLYILNQFNIVPWTPSPETVATVGTVLAALTPVLVYFIPNRKN